MRDSIRLSILVVSFNRKNDLDNCLSSLLPHLGDDSEVIILDNGSKDGTPEFISRKYPDFRMVSWPQNQGLAKALKHLADIAAGDWFFFLDSDTVIPPDGFRDFFRFAMSRPRLGAVAPRMIGADGEIQLTARNFPNPINALFGRQTLLSRMFPGNSITRRFLKTSHQEREKPFACDWVAFAAVIIRRKALEEAGSIDPDFFVYWVDADFFKRLRAKGWQVWCYPFATVFHFEENRAKRIRNPLIIKDFHAGALRFFFRHHGFYGLNPLLGVAVAGLGVRYCLHMAVNKWRIIKGK